MLIRSLLVCVVPYVAGLAPSCSRRDVLTSCVASSFLWFENAAFAEDNADTAGVDYKYESRDRNGKNRQALIREDYWYMMGKTPPRKLDNPLQGDDPQWNAFGTCESSGGTNSCTYVSLKQRGPAYSKYAFSIAMGAREYQELGMILQRINPSSGDEMWEKAASYVTTKEGTLPPPPVDALLKMILFATAMMVSPNFPTPSRELLVARFYANECNFATKEIQAAIAARDVRRARAAWEFGKDSWNSYFQVVNRSIVPKVGDKFEPIGL